MASYASAKNCKILDCQWFITTTFHDHHHKYFTANFGGYTTVWDRICGTVHKKFEDDFVKIKERPIVRPGRAGAEEAPAG